MEHIKWVYEAIKSESEGLDAIYEDYILSVIGLKGLDILLKNGLLESCGVVGGRQLYVLCEMNERSKE